MTAPLADVALVLEGTYPYVSGRVSNWTHDLIVAQADLTFHLVTIVPPGFDGAPRFALPPNVIGHTRVELQSVPDGRHRPPGLAATLAQLEEPLINLTTNGQLADLQAVLRILEAAGPDVGRLALIESREAWRLLLRMYERQCPHVSFLEYFWTWRSLLLSLYSVLEAPVAPARVYHALCTGYAGVYGARAAVETGRPVILTEHGIYTNERRIEIALADWLQVGPAPSLSIDRPHRNLRDLWVDTFSSYARACYASCRQIVTLYEGNAAVQVQDGADPAKLQIIPNGIAPSPLVRIRQTDQPPTVAFVGRVVPIKDVKTFLRAAAVLREWVPDVRVWILGALDEDAEYVEECREIARHLDLEATVTFAGQVDLSRYFPDIDVIALTSISEAQPLVILEAAAAGIPAVATDVGACREMILGRPSESPALGAAGAVTPLASPAATAEALRTLLTDRGAYDRASRAARARVRTSYDKATLDRAYASLYREAIESTQLPVAV